MIRPAAPPPAPDHRARNVALVFAGVVVAAIGGGVADRAGTAGAMRAATKLTIIVGIFIAVLVGWVVGGYAGAAAGLVIGVAVGVVPWRGQPLWSWLILWLWRRRPIEWNEPLTVANDRAGGGVRYQDGVAVVAVQLLGKAHTPTLFTGSTSTYTENAFDIS